MEYKKLGEINKYVGKNINPSNVSEEVFEMYSVPSFNKNYPEIIKGEDIGSSKQLVQKDDILLCKINPRINRVWIVSQFTDNKAIASSEWIVIRNKDMCARYLMWYFRSDYFRTLMISNVTGMGGSLMRAQPKQVQEYLVPVIDYDKQIRIAKVLDKAQELIDKRKKQIEELDELVKSRFIEMFGDTMVNPKGYSIAYLEDLADIVSGITKGRKVNGKQLKEVPYMRVANVKDGYIDWSEIKTIEATNEEIQRYCLFEGDVLMTEGGDPDKLGRGAILYNPPENCIHQNHIFRVRLNKEKMNSVFFSEYLKHPFVKRYFLKCGKQTTGIASINMSQLKKSPVLVPPIKIQNQFAVFVNQVDKLKFEMQEGLVQLEDNFNSLIQKAFKGELFN